MNTSPSIDDILEGIIQVIDAEIVPSLNNEKANATTAMVQALLQGVRQLLPVYDTYLVDEHNDMTRTLRDVAGELREAGGPAADRIRERAATLGAWADLPAPLDRGEVMAAHRELGRALEATMIDLDELQRAGDDRADAALQIVCGHLAPRYARDVATSLVGEGFVGRG